MTSRAGSLTEAEILLGTAAHAAIGRAGHLRRGLEAGINTEATPADVKSEP